MDEKTLVFGHRKPDTDSITASISLSYLKNQLGENTEPRALGSLNKETKYALNYFGVEEPDYLNDVKLQLKDINYHKDFILDVKENIYYGYKYILKEGLKDNFYQTGNVRRMDPIDPYCHSYCFSKSGEDLRNTFPAQAQGESLVLFIVKLKG